MSEYPGVRWLLQGEPRVVQLEALARSYTGYAYRTDKAQEMPPTRILLPHAGKPARGWGHLMEMRLGKTPTLLNEFMLFRADHGIKKALVLAPNKYKHTWALEAEQFGIPVPLHVFGGGAKARKEMSKFVSTNNEGMLFVHYEALQQTENLPILERWLQGASMIAADESVLIKNPNAPMSENAVKLSCHASISRILTGKPTPQSVCDLFSQLQFARKIVDLSFWAFRGKYALTKPGFKGKKKVVGIKNLPALNRLLFNTSFRAKRKDWGTQIDSDYEQVPLKMEPEQVRAYKSMEQDFVTWLDGGQVVSAEQVVTKHMKLQQISSGFILDEERRVHQLLPFDKTPKFKDLKDRLTNYETNKCIVCYVYNATGDLLQKHLSSLKDENGDPAFEIATIRGETHMKKAGKDVDTEKLRFNTDPRCRVMLAQVKAVKYGHTLMGTLDDPCLSTLYFENSYSLDDRAQSEQRNQGEGQQGAINIVDYYSSPVEQKIIHALQAKEEVAAVVMEHYTGATGSHGETL